MPLSKIPRRERPSNSTPRTATRSYQDTAHPRCSTEGAATLKEIFIFLSSHAVGYCNPRRDKRFKKLDQLMVTFVEHIFSFAIFLQQTVDAIETGVKWSKERRRSGKLPTVDSIRSLVMAISPSLSGIQRRVMDPINGVERELGSVSYDHETCGAHATRIGLGSSVASAAGAAACAYLSGSALLMTGVAGVGALVHNTGLGVVAALPATISDATTLYGLHDQDKTINLSNNKDVLEREQKAGGFVGSFGKLTRDLWNYFSALQAFSGVIPSGKTGDINALLDSFDGLKEELDAMLPVMIHWKIAREVSTVA
ncbi:hypothetical protein FRB94_013650 [Tulasnella sp. JGI-2019a]|nr:hypothetical protein FRB94_013650 [Tulasnella sp. JGI-2019a]KAG9010537.1 hypothetical protein FRB93_003805 [Tulasnella sp. JGI-2019a]